MKRYTMNDDIIWDITKNMINIQEKTNASQMEMSELKNFLQKICMDESLLLDIDPILEMYNKTREINERLAKETIGKITQDISVKHNKVKSEVINERNNVKSN